MNISKSDLEKFKQLWYQNFEERIDDTEAERLAMALLVFIRFSLPKKNKGRDPTRGP